MNNTFSVIFDGVTWKAGTIKTFNHYVEQPFTITSRTLEFTGPYPPFFRGPHGWLRVYRDTDCIFGYDDAHAVISPIPSLPRGPEGAKGIWGGPMCRVTFHVEESKKATPADTELQRHRAFALDVGYHTKSKTRFFSASERMAEEHADHLAKMEAERDEARHMLRELGAMLRTCEATRDSAYRLLALERSENKRLRSAPLADCVLPGDTRPSFAGAGMAAGKRREDFERCFALWRAGRLVSRGRAWLWALAAGAAGAGLAALAGGVP